MKILNENVENKMIIPTSSIEEISLLSADEAKQISGKILTLHPNRTYWYWLKNPVAGVSNCVLIIHGDQIDYTGKYPTSDFGIARPVLRLNQNFNLKNEQKVECLGLEWVYVGNNLILLNENAGTEEYKKTPILFSDIPFDENGSNQYQGSSIQKKMQEWLNEQLKRISNFLILFDDGSLAAETKEEVIQKIKEKVESGYDSLVTIVNQKTGVVKDLQL